MPVASVSLNASQILNLYNQPVIAVPIAPTPNVNVVQNVFFGLTGGDLSVPAGSLIIITDSSLKNQFASAPLNELFSYQQYGQCCISSPSNQCASIAPYLIGQPLYVFSTGKISGSSGIMKVTVWYDTTTIQLENS